MSAPIDAYVYRPTPVAGVAIGIVVLLAVALPPLFFDARHYLATSGIPMLLFVGVCIAGLVMLARSHVLLERDVTKRELRITRMRAPLAPVRVSVPLDSIASVELESLGPRSTGVTVVTHAGERMTAIAASATSDDPERVAAVIRGWLQG